MADETPMKRRYLIPEVIQTSSMDCGPASLKALFGGFDVYLSYGRLREACQTDVDGTSIDTIEVIAGQLGMAAVQSMLPADLLLLEKSACLPALVVVTLADGGTHFVVLWRVHGPWLQVMDPAAGRIWMPRRDFLKSLYIHEQAVPEAAWEEWSASEVFTAGLARRMRALDLPAQLWSDRAHQDAALRLAGTLREAGKLQRGKEAREFLALCADHADEIPAEFWTIRRSMEIRDHVTLRGAVLLRVAGLLAGDSGAEVAGDPLPASLARARTEPAPRVWWPVWEVLRESGWLLPIASAVALCAASLGTVIEALLFRALFDMGRHLHSTAERLGAVAALLLFLVTLLALDWSAALSLFRLGRQLEVRLRTRLWVKIPRLSDRYFHSRLISDMAFRAHSLQLLRQLPEIAGHCLHLFASILITGAAIAWVYPGSALLVSLAVFAACGVPALFMPAMSGRDLRYREIGASLGSFYLDSLLGSRAIQAHCAHRTLRAAQASLLSHWADAGLRQQALFVRAHAVQTAMTFTFIIALVYRQTAITQSPAGLLLLVYWAISIPILGREVGAVVQSLPAMRNTLLRFLELIGSPEDGVCDVVGEVSETAGICGVNAAACGHKVKVGECKTMCRDVAAKTRGIKIDIEEVSVVVAGHAVLERVTVHAQPGEHIGIVGVSGAGKSSLVGCLLGWHVPSSGSVRVDDAPLDAARLTQLRRETAWIDPQVHLFRTTLFENLRYGNSQDAGAYAEEAIEVAELGHILKRSPDGLQTPIGDGGTLVSGGEGQRLRAGRALGRTEVRLVILDEPARGLGREERRRLLATARRHFSGATLFCITHDVSDTLDFDRVLVIENGRVLEQGPPQTLSATPGSRFLELLDEERAVGRELWAHSKWRRMNLYAGALCEVRETSA
jgi:ABC-type bacteriocin/lantibiotic exporter with double-glycine peptidase domain